MCSGGRSATPCTEVVGTWMVFIRPVLKHGPKECNMRASLGWKTCWHNESEGRHCLPRQEPP